MSIEWNKVTWYSKVLAAVLFVAVFSIGFALGAQYQSIKDQPIGASVVNQWQAPMGTVSTGTKQVQRATTSTPVTTSPTAPKTTPPQNSHVTCSSVSDCPAHNSCTVMGPLIAGKTPQRVCVPWSQAIPL